MSATDLQAIREFLGTETPDRWVENALSDQNTMLIDHAHCEKKAAMTAVNLMHRYPDDFQLLNKMSRLAREELRHFEQVIKIIKKRDIGFTHLSAARYAAALRDEVRKSEPFRVIDILVVGAFIEARSCERFEKVAPRLDPELRDFYRSLLKSEARHFEDYLKLAKTYDKVETDERVMHFRQIESELIERPDDTFRFHSGPVN